jgi:preprotein translocase subunit SecA
MYLLKKIFGTTNDRTLKALKPLVQRVNQLEPTYKAMSDEDLRGQTAKFRERLSRGEPLDALMPDAFAVAREAGKRVLGMRHFDVQLIGGSILHSGKIAEMRTGEGKTLVATLPAYLNALPAAGVHIVTVNDYLARRDSEWMGRLYNFLGVSVGVVYAGMDESNKRAAYQADITYGQNNEFGFDYLRDNMKFSVDSMYQRGHAFAIVDEVDSILIDEARTPLIISGPAEDSSEMYLRVNKIIPSIEKEKHFTLDLKSKQPTLTEEGIARVESLLQIENLYDPANIDLVHHVNNALKAHSMMQRDVDYVVRDGEIIIVDEFTGRLMAGRRWSNGLHQAVEAKESVKIQRENQTLASVTFQNYFRMYKKLSGMTGTADTEAVEFKHIYGLDVVVIPTNRPMVRIDESDQVFRTRKEKYEAACEDIAEIKLTGQPVLVGTISIEQSELLSKILKEKGVEHNVLNAKQHEREAEIVAQAGRSGAVTISTNMAGRGTDIMLGGNPEFAAAAEAKTKDRADPAFIAALEKSKALCDEDRAKVIQAGGLFIMGTERHESRRIDNQLRGRAGRQGDPGHSRFYVSLEDDLMARFGGDRIRSIMDKIGWDEGVAIDGKLISRSIETAQKRVEAFHFEARKHVTEYDDVMNKQRQVIYGLRQSLVKGERVRETILGFLDDLLENAVLDVCDERIRPHEWDVNRIGERFQFLFKESLDPAVLKKADAQSIFDAVRTKGRDLYGSRVQSLNTKLEALDAIFRAQEREDGEETEESSPSAKVDKGFFDFEQHTTLETLDQLWNNHLKEMDHLREGIGLRGYGQKNPLYEYQREGFILFQSLMQTMHETVVRKIFFSEPPDPKQLEAQLRAERERREALEQQMQMVHESTLEPTAANADSAQGGEAPRNAEDQRARLAAQRKARRRALK